MLQVTRPGHQCIVINSRGERATVVGDVFHLSVQIEHPDWCVHVDLDKPSGQRCREDLLGQSEQEGMVIAAGHFKVDQHFGRGCPKARAGATGKYCSLT